MNALLRCMCMAMYAMSAFSTSAAFGAADDYPNRPLRMIIPYGPGGSTDLLGRMFAQRLGAELGQQIVVENNAGAGSAIGTSLVAKASPDGYTIGLLDTAFAINPSLYAKLPYDSLRDFDFLSIIATANGVLVVNSTRVAARSVEAIVAEAKRDPKKFNFASAGAGTIIHLHGETFKTAAGIDLLHVPYKGAGPATTDLLGGQVDMMFTLPALAIPHLKSGVLSAIAVTGNTRSAALPNVPTFAEAGYPTVNAVSLWVVAAPAGLPKNIQARLITAIGKAMEGPEVQAKLAEQTFERTVVPYPGSVTYLKEQMSKFAAAVKASGATAQ